MESKSLPIDLDIDEGVAVVTLNRPERLNALDAQMYEELSDVWSRVRDDDGIRVALLTGAGDRSFCVGADLRSLVNRRDLHEFWMTQQRPLLNRGLDVWKPVVAAVNGYCLGGGLTMLFATDIRLAVPEATFGLSEVKRGILPGNGGTQRLLAQLPHAVAMEMLLLGEPISAERALQWGLLNRVVERPGLMRDATAISRKLAANAPLALQAAKEAVIRSRDLSLGAGLRLEQAFNQLLYFTDDAEEGARAFSERREPRFRGE